MKKIEKKSNIFCHLINFSPDLVVFESTTPVMKFMWKTINDIKMELPKTLIVLTGYHSMRKPEETIKNSKTLYPLQHLYSFHLFRSTAYYSLE